MRRVFLTTVFFVLAGFGYNINAAIVQEEYKDYKKDLQKTQNELKSLRERIKKERALINRERGKEKAAAGQLRRLERELDITRKEMAVFENNVKVLERNLRELDSRIEENKRLIELKKNAVERIIRGEHKKGKKGYVKFLFNSKGFSEFIKRYKFMKVISRESAAAVAAYTNAIKQLEDDRESIISYRQEIEAMKKEKADRAKRFNNERKQKAALLNTIRANIGQKQKAVEDLEQSAKNLNVLLEKMAVSIELTDKEAGEAFTGSRGKFPWPVEGGRVVSSFGRYNHPKFGSIVNNRGIHISVNQGAPVFSVFKGTVGYAGWFDGYGKMVILNHGGGYYSIYGHLSEVFVREGQAVAVRQKIGEAGDTESFHGPALYFELRNRTTPMNPITYLSKR
ncbi:MAG TPA: hypothetical protein ENN43_01480 [bacterium]|nr:hypothetical protein [bacterium]